MWEFTAQSQNCATSGRKWEIPVPMEKEKRLGLLGRWNILKKCIVIYMEDLCQTSQDRNPDAVGAAFYLGVNAPSDIDIHKLKFADNLILCEMALHA